MRCCDPLILSLMKGSSEADTPLTLANSLASGLLPEIEDINKPRLR